MPVRLAPTLRHRLAVAPQPLIGLWACSGSALVAEICASSGADWILLDMEHSPNGLESVLTQLQALAGYPATPVVRVSSADAVTIKQVLDLGAQTILVPMVSTPDQARAVVAATRYPPHGIRGVGSALARSSRWNRVDRYLMEADEHVSVLVQIETTTGVDAAAAVAAVDGVDGVLVGPSDLAASMGMLGQQSHPDVIAAVNRAFVGVRSVGKPVGVNAFDPEIADAYLAAGASFVLVGADVAIVARGTEQAVARFRGVSIERAGY